jgi:hypothetical protein
MGYDFSYSEGIDKIDYERLKFDGRFENKEVKNAVFINYELPLDTISLLSLLADDAVLQYG